MGAGQAVSEAIGFSVNTAELRCCIHIRPVTLKAFSLPDILMASFMEISHFSCPCTCGETRPFFLKVTGEVTRRRRCSAVYSKRARKDGNEFARACKKKCQEENESGIGNELRILWESCVCKGFLSYHPLPPLSDSSLSPGGHESEAGQQPEEESQRDRNAAFGPA